VALPDHLRRIALESDVTPFKSSGPGGQKKNKTESSVRVTHHPTGIVRIATESRSQLVNKETALERVWDEIQRRAKKKKPRRATRPTKSAVEKRLTEKRIRSVRKRERRDGDD